MSATGHSLASRRLSYLSPVEPAAPPAATGVLAEEFLNAPAIDETSLLRPPIPDPSGLPTVGVVGFFGGSIDRAGSSPVGLVTGGVGGVVFGVGVSTGVSYR